LFPQPIVINEWLFHDIDGSNGLQAQQRVELFLDTFRNGNDKIVVLRDSSWTHKAWQLWTHNDVRVQILSKLLYLGILIDPLKRTFLNPEEVQPLPPGLAAQVPDDDAYLFQTAIAGGARIIVTTDGRLIEMVTNANDFGIELRLRDEFYLEYLGS